MSQAQTDGLRLLHDAMRECRRCVVAGFPVQPGPVFSGPASARMILIGAAPSRAECESGRPFEGEAGRTLFGWLEKAGFGEKYFRAEQYITAVTRCHPGAAESGRGDRTPGPEELELCWPFLERELSLVSPLLIVPVGRPAIKPFLGSKGLNEIVGFAHQDELGRWIVPLPHPVSSRAWLKQIENHAHLERAIRHLSRLRRRLRL